ncbi:hypothetical protein LguiB_020736 [Lonicera macranthoides]
MPPKRDICRNFQRGSCQYGARCKFLHASQQNSKPNAFGFGTQNDSQFQHANSQQQKPNPFGFGVQNNSQPRGFSDFGSKQNQAKPFENKWSRFSPLNAGGSSAPRQPENQPPAANHNCMDPESCKRQIVEDFEHERPLWKLTCYSHSRNGPCDIAGDISYEELRATAYDDAKRGLSLQSIVERERVLLNSKLQEFESLLRNPYTSVPQNSNLSTHNPFPAATPIVSPFTPQNPAPHAVSPFTLQNPAPPAVSSFSQLGNVGFGIRQVAEPTAPNSTFGQPNSFQIPSQTSSMPATNNLPFKSGSFGSQFPVQSFGSPFGASTSSLSNSVVTAERNPFSTLGASPQITNSASNNLPMLSNMPSSSFNTIAESNGNVPLLNHLTQKLKLLGSGHNNLSVKIVEGAVKLLSEMTETITVLIAVERVARLCDIGRAEKTGDNSTIWSKPDWNPGEIPEDAPPDEVIA